MKTKDIWNKLKIWQRGVFIGILVGFLPLQLIFLYFPKNAYIGNELMHIWILFHLVPALFLSIVWFFVYLISAKLGEKNKKSAKTLIIVVTAIYIALLIIFFQFESFVWGLSEI